MKCVTVRTPLAGLITILEIRRANPDLETIRIEGAEALESVARIIEPLPWWPPDTAPVDKIRGARAVVLTRQRNPAGFGQAVGFTWAYE